jgi:rhodanese-related sulfurtransferase
MTEIMRVAPKEIYPRVKSGAGLLVCAYDSEENFRSMILEGAISLNEFKARVSQLPKDQEIIFYCA